MQKQTSCERLVSEEAAKIIKQSGLAVGDHGLYNEVTVRRLCQKHFTNMFILHERQAELCSQYHTVNPFRESKRFY